MNQLYAQSRPQTHKPHTAWTWCLLLGLLILSFSVSAQVITGTVFRDFNANGAYEAVPVSVTTAYAYGEPGVGGVRVTAYNASGGVVASTLSSTATVSLGVYTLTVGATPGPFRVEFTSLLAGDFDSFRGAGSGTSVQFVAGAATGVNYGVSYPAEYCQQDPGVVTTCFVGIDPINRANPSAGSPFGNLDVLIGAKFGVIDNQNPVIEHYEVAKNMGAVFGLAYDKKKKVVYTGAFTKRHAGFGAAGPGAIYVTPTAPTATTGLSTVFYNFNGAAGTDMHTDLPISTTPVTTPSGSVVASASYDIPAFDAVGKTGLGDMDISDEMDFLYVVNLLDRKLYKIDVATKAVVSSFDIPNPCGGQSYRPFALKYYRGKVYVGVTCTREDLGSYTTTAANNYLATNYGPTSGLSAKVFSFDGGTFTKVLDADLSYLKAPVNANTSGQSRAEYWRPWTNSFKADSYPNNIAYPSPWLTDIEFDVNGSMILGIRDRFGDQTGNRNFLPIQGQRVLIEPFTMGEILRAGQCSPGQWKLEENGSTCTDPATSAFQTSNTLAGTTEYGPSTANPGQYYWGNRMRDGGNHGVTSMGTLALLPGSGKVMMTAIDPLDQFFNGGLKRLINATGAKDGNPVGTDYNPGAGVNLYQGISTANNPGAAGKANGLGDLELLCNPAPIQIGNRVWKDTNNNGVQDPGEPALAGITVTLKGPGLPAAGAAVTTNANGEYYFANAAGTNATGFVYSLTGLVSGGAYTLTFPTSASAGALLLSSKPNSATGTNADAIDSDPNAAGVVSFTLGQAGQNNFSYDAGFIDTPPCALTATVVSGTCNPANNLYAISGTISLTSAVAGTATVTDGARSTTVTIPAAATSVAYSLTGLTSGTGSHTVVINLPGCGSATAAYTAPASCLPRLSVVVGTPVCNTLTNNYTATGTVSLTNATAGSLTITDNNNTATVVSVTAGQTSASFSLTGVSGSTPPSHTVVATLTGGTSASTTYATPASCTVCSLSLTTTNLPAGQVGTPYSQTLTTSGATGATSFTLAGGSLPAGLTLNASTNVISGTPTSATTVSFTVGVGDAKGCTATAPLTITVNPVPTSFCSLTVTPTAGACTTVTNGTTVSGVFSSTINVQFVANTPAGTLVISDGSSTTTVAVSANQPGVVVIFTGLPADGNTRTVSYDFTIGATDCGAFSLTYVAPASCVPTPPANPVLTLTKLVNKSRAAVGEVISYSVVLTNTASASAAGTTATNITVQDNLTGGTYVAASASAPTGTTFTPGSPTGTWQIASLAGGQSLTLTLQAQAAEGGVVYNTATIPGTATATVCTSVPVQVCAGDVFEYEISAAPGRSSYRWFRTVPGGTETELTSFTTNVLSVTAVGEYRLAVDNVEGLCPDFSCCPFVVEEAAPVASFSLVATPLSCSGSVAQTDGTVRVVGLVSSTATGPLTYQVASGGTDFASGVLLTPARLALPAGGIVQTGLGAGTYRVRVFNAAGCFSDAEVVITPVNCTVECPPAKCAPFVIQQTKKGPRVVSN